MYKYSKISRKLRIDKNENDQAYTGEKGFGETDAYVKKLWR